MTTNKKSLNHIYVLVILLFTFIKSDAQKAEFGVRYMPTFSSLNLNSSTGGTIKGEVTLGFGMGAFIGFNFTDHMGIQGEIDYNSLSQQYTDHEIKKTINLKYINIPLLFSLNTGKTNAVNLNVVAGPQLGLNVGSSFKSSSEDGTTSATGVLAVKKSDVGFAYGFGLDFGLNNARTTRLGLGYRGLIGMFDISDNTTPTSEEVYYVLDDTRHSSKSLYIGLSILF
jgi:hypothetical protein